MLRPGRIALTTWRGSCWQQAIKYKYKYNVLIQLQHKQSNIEHFVLKRMTWSCIRPGLPSASSLSSVGPGEGESFPILTDYPWFHGTLSRGEAAAMVDIQSRIFSKYHLNLQVLHHSTSGHGVFLVRQSETRKGEFVLTFNFQVVKFLRIRIHHKQQRSPQSHKFHVFKNNLSE